MIDVVVVGFGFSAVPLIRELESTGTDFQIISSESNSVWDNLSKKGRLDFDLVSSYLTSFYSFDLADRFQTDYYPCAPEYYEMHQKWFGVYGHRVVRDVVTKVDNFADHSVVHTQSGNAIKARHVVIATGFSRAILSDLATTDYNAPNQTFVFDTMGDSVNLMISHLIPHNAKVIIRTNGFHARDKVVPVFGTTYTLDQLEFHNFRYVSHSHYGSIVYGAPVGSDNPILFGDQFPVSVRDESWNTSKSRPASGSVAIKYWPIDEYSRKFGNDLDNAISKGYVLNDIAMWLHTGRAIVVPKDTPIDFAKKTITYAGIERAFDHYVKGDLETPRLPPIMIEGSKPYKYVNRDSFMGVIPKALRNIYTIGFVRPYTGGLANIIEMQGLLIHKLITQPAFHDRIHRNLPDRVAAYNEHYFGNSESRPWDHLVYYGFYTDDVARLIGIEHKPADCITVNDLVFYYAFPNNAFKYRLKGEYAVKGVDELIEKVNRQFNSFVISFAYMLSSSLKDPSERAAWLLLAQRNFFNDMRHKERYRVFLDRYIQTYRRLKNVRVADVEDRVWNALVVKASEARDRAVQRIKIPSQYQLDYDVAREMQSIQSWMNGGRGQGEIRRLRLDPKRTKCLASLMNPPEYNLPYLQ